MISANNNYLSLKIDDDRADKLIVKIESGKLKIYPIERIMNPSVWHLSQPDISQSLKWLNQRENADFDAYFAEFYVFDLNRNSGPNIKNFEITGSTCLMQVEVYNYPKVGEE